MYATISKMSRFSLRDRFITWRRVRRGNGETYSHQTPTFTWVSVYVHDLSLFFYFKLNFYFTPVRV